MRRRNAFKQISAGLVLVLGVGLCSACQSKTVDYGNGETTESTVAERNGAKKGIEQFADAPAWQDEWKTADADGNEVMMTVDADITIPDVRQMYVVEVEEVVLDKDCKERVAKEIFEEPEITDNADEYQGKRDGIFYTLSFADSLVPDVSPGVRYRAVVLTAKDEHQVCPEQFADTKGDISFGGLDHSGAGMKNQCTLSEEEAGRIAEDFVDKLGLGYSVCSGSTQILWQDFSHSGNDVLDGYLFYFDAGIDEISFVSYGTAGEYGNFSRKKKDEEKNYDLLARAEIGVTDKGVIWMTATCPVEVIGVSGETPLLSLPAVKEIMKDQAINEFENLRLKADADGQIVFDQMELIYFRIRDREHEGRYSYVPAWRLGSKPAEDNYHIFDNPILINAIDGSVINFYDEV